MQYNWSGVARGYTKGVLGGCIFSGLEQTQTIRLGCGLGSAAGIEFAHNVADMFLDSGYSEKKFVSNVTVRGAACPGR